MLLCINVVVVYVGLICFDERCKFLLLGVDLYVDSLVLGK